MKEEVIAFGEEGCLEVGRRNYEGGRSRPWRGKKEGRNKEVRS